MPQLTPEFYQHVAAATVTLILIVLLLWPRKKKEPKWDISSHFAYLSACIKSSANHKELDIHRERVDGFYDRYYRKVSTDAVKRYYARLLQLISQKEIQLNATAKKVPAGAK